ncbi:MAG TPA: hypothetical protein PK425_04890 [Syntrophales bacterium]|jgi:hypothetical protein|nr:hypothetical protein [Syntrophales bacterium]
MAGVNRAYLIKVEKANDIAEERKKTHPCVFLVHVSVAREAALAIGDYISRRGEMDIYLDLFDDRLPAEGDPDQLVRYLREGLQQASHVMGLVPPEAPEPWWISRVLELAGQSGAELSLLALKGINKHPACHDSFEVLRGIKSLNEYLFRVSPLVSRIIFNNPEYGGLMVHTAPHHPLDGILEWNR